MMQYSQTETYPAIYSRYSTNSVSLMLSHYSGGLSLADWAESEGVITLGPEQSSRKPFRFRIQSSSSLSQPIQASTLALRRQVGLESRLYLAAIKEVDQ